MFSIHTWTSFLIFIRLMLSGNPNQDLFLVPEKGSKKYRMQVIVMLPCTTFLPHSLLIFILECLSNRFDLIMHGTHKLRDASLNKTCLKCFELLQHFYFNDSTIPSEGSRAFT